MIAILGTISLLVIGLLGAAWMDAADHDIDNNLIAGIGFFMLVICIAVGLVGVLLCTIIPIENKKDANNIRDEYAQLLLDDSIEMIDGELVFDFSEYQDENGLDKTLEKSDELRKYNGKLQSMWNSDRHAFTSWLFPTLPEYVIKVNIVE